MLTETLIVYKPVNSNIRKQPCSIQPEGEQPTVYNPVNSNLRWNNLTVYNPVNSNLRWNNLTVYNPVNSNLRWNNLADQESVVEAGCNALLKGDCCNREIHPYIALDQQLRVAIYVAWQCRPGELSKVLWEGWLGSLAP